MRVKQSFKNYWTFVCVLREYMLKTIDTLISTIKENEWEKHEVMNKC